MSGRYTNFCLGRGAHDPVKVAAVPGHTLGIERPPPSCKRADVPFAPGMYDNDSIPDCTAAGLANAASAASWMQGWGVAIDPAKVPAFYGASIGHPDVATLADTHGAIMLDVLQYQALLGFDVGQQSPLMCDFARIEPGDRAGMAMSIAKLGCVYLGVGLALADQTTSPWDTGVGDNETLGSWGGHCVMIWDYDGLADHDMVRIGTWGTWQQATWRWVQARTEEAYALSWRQITPPSEYEASRTAATDWQA